MSKNTIGVGRWQLALAVLTLLFGSGFVFRFFRTGDSDSHAQRIELSIVAPAIPGPIVVPEVKTPSILANPANSQQPLQIPIPVQLDLTLEHFVATYASLREKDRPLYLQSLVGKQVCWTGYVSQVYLSENYLYLSESPNGPTTPFVCVAFDNTMRLGIAAPSRKVRASGTVEIRGDWIVINATKLVVCL